MEKETNQVYYVWYDLLMEEHFSMLKHQLDNSFVKMKEQLLIEKNVFHEVNATNSMEAISIFKEKKKLSVEQEVLPNTFIDNTSSSSGISKRKLLH